MTMSRCAYLLVAMAITFLSDASQAATIALAPVVEGTAEDRNKDGIFSVTGPGPMFVSNHAEEGEKRGLAEFPLQDVPSEVTVDSVKLLLSIGARGGFPLQQVYSYQGDGDLDAQDALASHFLIQFSIPFPTDNRLIIELPVPFFQELLDQHAPFAGLTLREATNTALVEYVHDAFLPGSTHLVLDVGSRTVDEPTEATLLVALVLVMLALPAAPATFRRRRQPQP
jgi:hypothetical protein